MPNLTRSDLVTRIGDLTQDPSHQEWSSSKKQQKIEEAQERFILDTRALVDTSTGTCVDGTSEYSLPTDVLDITRLAHKGIRLRRMSKFDLDIQLQSDWSDDTGTPRSYFVDLDPNNKVYRVYPTPQAADAGANLTIEYIKIPPALSADSSVPFDGHTLMTPYHMAIVYFAAAELLKQNPDEARIAKIRLYQKEYEILVAQCRETFKAMSDTVPLRMRGGRYFKEVS
jgi:hypothetical protein